MAPVLCPDVLHALVNYMSDPLLAFRYLSVLNGSSLFSTPAKTCIGSRANKLKQDLEVGLFHNVKIKLVEDGKDMILYLPYRNCNTLHNLYYVLDSDDPDGVAIEGRELSPKKFLGLHDFQNMTHLLSTYHALVARIQTYVEFTQQQAGMSSSVDKQIWSRYLSDFEKVLCKIQDLKIAK